MMNSRIINYLVKATDDKYKLNLSETVNKNINAMRDDHFNKFTGLWPKNLVM